MRSQNMYLRCLIQIPKINNSIVRICEKLDLYPSLSLIVYSQILGLEVCADTLVGDEMLRGISGGQKKRVTTGKIIQHLEQNMLDEPNELAWMLPVLNRFFFATFIQ